MRFSQKLFQKKLLSWSLIDEKLFQVYFWSNIPQPGDSEVEVTTCASSTELVNQFVFGGRSSIGCRETDTVPDIEVVRWV